MNKHAKLAQRLGIEMEYIDAHGRHRVSDPEGVQRIAAALSPFVGSGSQQSLSRRPPRIAYQGRDGRFWGLALQLYEVRSARNWGHGDFSDLAGLLKLAAQRGAAAIGINPLHALFPDQPENASPYAPNSRLFFNALYIDIEALPEFPGVAAAGLGNEVERLKATSIVDYAAVARVKLSALRLSHRCFQEAGDYERQRDLEDFRTERGAALARFATFETLRARFGGAWRNWPTEWQRADDRVLAAVRQKEPDAVAFHEYVQWNADRQLRECYRLARRLDLAIGIYADLAVGVHPDGADAWSGQDTMLTGMSVGAPPDLLNTAGQDWGLITFDPHRLRQSGFRPFWELLDANMRYAGALRIDHVLGLKRIWLVPHGLNARQGAYLKFPLERMLTTVAEASNRNHCIVVGEDLGTVPPGFRETLAPWGLWSYRVLLFERDHEGYRASERYPANAVATLSTHDLPTYAGWMSGHDLRIKRSIGIDPGESDDERQKAREALRRALVSIGKHDTENFSSIARFLAHTPSRLVMVSIQDVLGIEDQVNVPGTTHEHPNWRRRLPVSIEDLARHAGLKQIAGIFADAGRHNDSQT